MKGVVAFLKQRWFLELLGLLLIALVVWFAGPYLAFAEYRPLDSVVERLIVILVLVLLWAGINVLRSVRAQRASNAIAADMAGQPSGAASGRGGDTADVSDLKRRFQESVEVLQKQGGKDKNLYSLPWYIIIGPPGSGKTTALVNSGLKFPVAQKYGEAAIRGVGGTRNCDWWFTDEAILLDTAGRYVTQDSDQSADSAEWTAFLQLLRKHRRRRPINGALVTMSVADLVLLSPQERARHVAAVRARIEELQAQLRISFPVYFLVTKADLIAGFTEFFDDLGQEERQQVWGMTFPYDSKRRQAAPSVQAFPQEFEALLARLQERLWTRLDQERDPRRRAAVFGFPQQFASIRPALQEFLGEVFGGSRFDQKVNLRGVYFTSGTQEGTPIDRLLGAVARTFGLDNRVLPQAQIKGRSYFIHDVLRKVAFAESGLAGVDRKYELQKLLVTNFAYAASLLIGVLLVAGLWNSYRLNSRYLDNVAALVAEFTAKAPPGNELSVVADRLGAFRIILGEAEQHNADRPWTMQFGLFQGKSVGGAVRDAYYRQVNSQVTPAVARALETRIRSLAGDPERLYEYLKAYLMLGEPQRLDRAHLGFVADFELTAGGDPAARDLMAHFRELLADDGALRPVSIDRDLVAAARTNLQTATLPNLVYSRLRTLYAGDKDRALRLDEAGGLGVDRVLLRGSGRKLSDPIPALYTKPVFEEVARKDSAAMLLEFQKEYWVLGDEGALQRLGSSSEIVAEVLRIYEDDYIKFWKGTLGDLKLAPTDSREQLLEALRILSSDSSPLKGVLKLIAKNTDFGEGVGPDATGQALDKLGAAAGKAATASTGRLGSLFGAQAPAAAAGGGPKPGKRISESFAELQQLVGGDGPVPLDATLKLLADMYTELEGTGAGLGQQSAVAALSQGGGSPKARQLRDEAARLPPPLGEMFAQLGGGGSAVAMTGARSELAAAYREMVLTDCRQVVKGRYPFDRNATQEVPMADFARFFGAGGTLDSFFKQQLAPLVDTTQSRWRWRSRDGASVALPQSLLDHFQQGARLREAFFAGGGAQPSVRFTLVPDFLDANYTRILLEVDGEQLDYRHGPVRTLNVTWPKADFGRVTASLEGPDGSRQVLAAEGPWALFRALDRAQLKAEGGTRYSFELGGGAARIRLEASSLRNPFDMRLVQDFRCVEGL